MIFYIKIIFLLIFLWIKSCSGAEISNSLFPSTLGITNQNESIFIEHQIVSNSDVLLVKCPSHFYKHNNNNFKFTVNELIRDLQVKKIDSKNDTIIWYYIVNPKAEKENISLLCGELIFRSGGSTSLIQWIVNIVWKSKPNPLLTNDTYNAEGSLYSPKKCNGTNDLLPFIKYSRTQIIKMFNDKVDKVYKGDILYAFDLTKAIGPIEYLLPCSIDKPYHSSPVIGIEDHQPEEIKFDNTKIRYIKKNINKEKFKFKLDIIKHSHHKDFFKYENVKATIMTFTKKEGLKLDINKDVIENEIIVNSYEIVKVQYTCDSCSENSTDLRTFEETYFFAPKKNLIVKEKISHFINELEYKPNCSINDYKFAYFYYVKFENTKSTIDELRDNGNKNFVLENNKVLYNNKNPNGILSCVYKMVNEEYTVSQQYELNVEGIIKVDDDGKKYLATKKSLQDSKNANITIIAIVIGTILILLIILIIFLFFSRVKIMKFLNKRKLQKNYPNVYKYWEFVKDIEFEKLAQMRTDALYVPEKLRELIEKKEIIGGEEVVVKNKDLFKDTLALSQRNVKSPINAYYVNMEFQNNVLFLSDAPNEKDFNKFWNMIYREKIKVIISISNRVNDKNVVNGEYWPSEGNVQNFDGFTVKNVCKKDVKVIDTIAWSLEIDDKRDTVNSIYLYQVNGWKSNSIPECLGQIIDLFESVNQLSGVEPILIHSDGKAGSRVFLFTYFSGIVMALKKSKIYKDPFLMIKQVRDQREGGNISAMDFIVLNVLIVEYFVKNKIIMKNEDYLAFKGKYDDYVYSFRAKENSLISEIRPFLLYILFFDESKVREYEHHVQDFNSQYKIGTNERCTKFLEALKYQEDLKQPQKKVIRYNDIMCNDKNIVETGLTSSFNGHPYPNFINANYIEYTGTYTKRKRKIIMCQAPNIAGVEQMYSMLYTQNVGLLVNLCCDLELKTGNKNIEEDLNWHVYYPTKVDESKTVGVMKITQQSVINEVQKNVTAACYALENTSKKDSKNVFFNLIHYNGWTDKDIPSNHMELYNLYKYIMSNSGERPIVIHCSAGIGRTGTLALLIYMIDNITAERFFDPILCLRNLRESRYQAIQTNSQFKLALLCVFEHFKAEIHKLDEELFGNLKIWLR